MSKTSEALKGKTSRCLSPSGATLYKTVDEREDNTHVQNKMALQCAKTCANW